MESANHYFSKKRLSNECSDRRCLNEPHDAPDTAILRDKPCQTHTQQSLTSPHRSRNAFQIFWNFGPRICSSRQCCAAICRNSTFHKARGDWKSAAALVL